jgi:hypothetical protein
MKWMGDCITITGYCLTLMTILERLVPMINTQRLAPVLNEALNLPLTLP